ncbi:MAG: recombination mediator RecR [Candidatus Omnitrophota bacterium]
MSAIPKSLTRLIENLSRLPGIGAKTAQRLAFFILRSQREYAEALVNSIKEVKDAVVFCEDCNNLSEGTLCEICGDPTRNKGVLCIVENPNDVVAVEKMGQFEGRYFCLMGALSPLDSVGPEELKIDKLIKFIEREKIKEAIIATDSDEEGNTTALYLARVLKPLGVRLTRIAFGLPVGSNIEYADQATLIKAFEGRRPL